MYRVVIIDDEPIIVEGLSRVVPWEKYECEVVGSAMDGEEGLELIRKVKPDIVFSDIYMPKMDGLLLAAAIKSEFEQIELTILTGYRDFDLLQKALHLGVTRYILKPSSMKELEEAVQTMTEKLRKRGILPDHAPITYETGVVSEKYDAEDSTKDAEESTASCETAADPSSDLAENSSDAASAGLNVSASSFLVRNAMEYIQKNYRSRLTLKEVADHIYVSQWHLSKLLNKHAGKSFSDILNTVRINAAKELLKNPSLRVGDVAEQVGFLDIAHFSRVFKKITGMSANEYRNHLN